MNIETLHLYFTSYGNNRKYVTLQLCDGKGWRYGKLCKNIGCMACYNKSFASSSRAMYWSSKNGDLKARDYFISSQVKAYFDCECGHTFESKLSTVTDGSWCPYCAQLKLCSNDEYKMCYTKSFASSPKAKYWSPRNGDIRPRDFRLSSGVKAHFDCECGHTFESALGTVTDGSWCPYCSNSKLCSDDDCKMCYTKSFASSKRAKYWSPKNGDLKPRDYLISSQVKAYFDCECGHTFESKLGTVTDGSWCPYCSNSKLCSDDDCKICYTKSFASSPRAKYWSPKNGDLKPRNFGLSSDVKAYFDCECGHIFYTNISHIGSRNGWCPYCSCPCQKMCDDKECRHCYNMSFASSQRAKWWSTKNGSVTPRDVCKSSNKSFYFDCEKCNVTFSKKLVSITSQNGWCPSCVNTTETKVYDTIVKDYPTITTQFCRDWCRNPKTNWFLYFDFCIEEHKIIIEVDGEQHFRQVRNWGSPEHQFERDLYKMQCANTQGYSVIRVFQPDIWYDRIDWYKLITDSIKTIVDKGTVENHYISFNPIYDHYIEALHA